MKTGQNELGEFLWVLRRALYVLVRWIEARYGPGPRVGQPGQAGHAAVPGAGGESDP